ncbi:MAG: Stp1/IreP family PP2C-type Ser/Thr phosphatase [Lachnospiraceae bacterium]|jgi:protein phosphatase|nr:Stp1/IreP family PP2C-type Ser/Thr phosphatase [Lachnospiraceae bacterium]
MLKTFSKTDIGRKRRINQDNVYSCEVPLGNLPNLFIVCDGMGGHKAGDFASAYAVKAIEREIMLCEETEPVRIIREAIECANAEIFEKAASDEQLRGMGTTAVVATIVDGTLIVANVGDSRLYIINDDIEQITKDHSLVEEMVRIGELDRSEAREHPDKNIITRALGVTDSVEVDFFEVELKKGDIILMCSDGLTNMVEDEDIRMVVKAQRDVVQIVEELIKIANHNGGSDNIGVVVIESDEVGK